MSNNDASVRIMDAAVCQMEHKFTFPWAVNCTARRPNCNSNVIAVVGDDPTTCIMDVQSGKQVAALKGHLDFSFAAAWHPNGYMLATGNQDTSTLIWDMRYTGAAQSLSFALRVFDTLGSAFRFGLD